jgi:hypothetical protein
MKTEAARRLAALQRNPNRGCRDMNTEWFFPNQGEYDSPELQQAKRACRSCPLSRECLDIALALGSTYQYGIWGGTSPRQRTTIIRRRREAAA